LNTPRVQAGDEKEPEVYGGPAREEWRGLWPYVLAGIAYIGLAQIYPGILYSFVTGMVFLLACIKGLPWLWRKAFGSRS